MATPIQVGINGFGRIGRKVLRLALESEQIEVVAINDLGDVRTLAHLLKYDSVHGTLKQDVRVEGDSIVVGSKKVKVLANPEPSALPWGDLGAAFVHECTGRFTQRDLAARHIEGGARKVIISAPAKGPDATLCMGVNHESYDPGKHDVVSNASCTTNCLAPMVKAIDDAFGLVRGTMTTVHSYTNDQRILDLPHSDLRRARAAAASQIPTTTGAAKAVGLVLPHLNGKLDGIAIRVPTPNVSLVDFCGEVRKGTTKEELNAALKAAAEGPLKGVLAYSDEPLVSIDYNGSTASSTVDSLMTTVLDGTMVKCLSWYDNESGFSQRMIDLTVHMAKKGM